MDWACNKKIKKYVLTGLFIVLSITVGLVVCSVCDEIVERKQIMELIENYPELESEVIYIFQNTPKVRLFERDSEIQLIQEKYGFQLYKDIFSKEILFLFGVIIFSCAIGIAYLHWDNKKQSIQDEALRNMLVEGLQKFRKGDYESVVTKDLVMEHLEVSEQWETSFEALKELGYYFKDLKKQLIKEENSTKALITDISHQLKTPLASLRMCHELTMSENVTEEERKEFQEQEKQEIEKLELLLNELVKLSRLENHMVQIQVERQAIRKTISEAVSQIYGKAKGKQIEIQVDMQKDINILHDRKWTVEALSNVLDNAIKYSDAQTVIQVRVQSLPSNLLIEIEDQGMGIPSEELHNIFKRFYRGKEAGKKDKDGVGVGLYLARYIIELQGGTISAKRKQKKGSIFRITLPL